MNRPPVRRPDTFERDDRVGSGTYGEVFRKRGQDGELLAIKRSKKSAHGADDNRIPPSTFRELVLLSEIDYPHINQIRNRNITCDDQTISIGYEYGVVDVRKVIHYYREKTRDKMIPRVIVKSILFQLLLALDHLHQRRIAHCDITPPNLLIMSPTSRLPGIVKLIDLGLARVIGRNEPRHYGVVTIWYRAPELLLGCTNYTEKIDIWAAGCIFFELLKCDVLFKVNGNGQEVNPTEFNQNQISQIIDVLGYIPPEDLPMQAEHLRRYEDLVMMKRRTQYGISGNFLKNRLPPDAASDSNLYDLLSRMLEYNPAKRISAGEALRHPYFSDEPICVMNVAGQFPREDWEILTREGSRSLDAK